MTISMTCISFYYTTLSVDAGKKLDQSASTAVSITGKPPDGQPFQVGRDR